MYDFIRIQYQLGRITKEQVEQFAEQGWITDTEAEQITDKIVGVQGSQLMI